MVFVPVLGMELLKPLNFLAYKSVFVMLMR